MQIGRSTTSHHVRGGMRLLTASNQHEEAEPAGFARAVAATWPLVGRDALLQQILAGIDGGGRGTVLIGAAGVGKSRLARSVFATAARRGLPTEWIQASEASGDLPLGAFSHLLPTGADASTPLDLLRRTAMLLQARARRARLLLVVDDAHLLDPASATLVHQLASSGDLFVLATVRTGEDVPDAIVSLWKDGLAERIDVDVLAEDEVGDLLRTALGAEVEVATCHRLWSATSGNALFLHELVLSGLGSGALRHLDHAWAWRGPVSGGGRLRDVVAARLAPLGLDERAALDLLAVGEPLGIDVFERLVGIEIVDRLERQDLVTIRRDDRREQASLSHPVYRDLLRAALSPEAVADAQERLAAAVEAAGGRRRGDLLRVALWRLHSPADTTVDLLIAAAHEAESRFDPELAERLGRAAVEREEGSAAWHVVASSLRSQGRVDEADEAWATALRLEPDPTERVVLAQARSANLFFGSGEVERAIAALEDVYADATTPALRDTIGSLVGMFDLYRGRIDTALAASVPVLDRAKARGDSIIDAALTASAAYALRGQPSDGIAVVDANIGVALQDPDVGSIAAGALMATRLLALSLDGQLIEALEGARIVYELAVDMGTHDGIAGLSFAIGHIHETMGNVDAARRHLAEGVALLREHDRNGYLRWCLGELAYVDVVGGRLDEARKSIEELDRIGRPELRLFWPRIETARLLLLGIEAPAGAVEGFLAVGAAAADDGHLVLGAMALHDALRFGGASAVVDPLARLGIATDSALVRAFAAHARAAAVDEGAALDEVSVNFELMGALLFAAEAARRASAAHARAGRNPQRAAAEARAAGLLSRCEGAAPPWLAPTDAVAPLSGRQLEVAELAALGLSSREIADQLFVSVRTVDNHLYRTYAKLGVDSRDELALVLRSAARPLEGE